MKGGKRSDRGNTIKKNLNKMKLWGKGFMVYLNITGLYINLKLRKANTVYF